jgi:hypothetical protein
VIWRFSPKGTTDWPIRHRHTARTKVVYEQDPEAIETVLVAPLWEVCRSVCLIRNPGPEASPVAAASGRRVGARQGGGERGEREGRGTGGSHRELATEVVQRRQAVARRRIAKSERLRESAANRYLFFSRFAST